jgi:hypothetical protein
VPIKIASKVVKVAVNRLSLKAAPTIGACQVPANQAGQERHNKAARGNKKSPTIKPAEIIRMRRFTSEERAEVAWRRCGQGSCQGSGV